MIANGRGFLHDFDYAFDWKAFLYVRGFEETIESWEEYVRTKVTGIRRQDAGTDEQPPVVANESTLVGSPNEGHSCEERFMPPPPVINKAGEKEYYVDGIIA